VDVNIPARRNFPDWIEAYKKYSSNSEAPDKFHFWTAVSAIAGALRRQVYFPMGHFNWYPNFYIIFVAPPGIVSKSSTAAIGMSLLKQVKGIKFGADSTTWQALATNFSESRTTYMFDGKLQVMCAMTLVSSELGTLLKPQDGEMMDVFVDLWDGRDGTWTKATKTQGKDEVVNPWINVIGCTTPAWIGQNMNEYIVGGGFTSRTVFVYADQKRRLVAYPGDDMAFNHDLIKQQLIDDLSQISKLCGAYSLTPEAKAWGEQWYSDHYTKTPTHLKNDRVGGYVARKQTHIHKLAMVLAASKGNSLLIDLDTIKMAEAMVTQTETDMPKVFSEIGKADAARDIGTIISHVRAVGGISKLKLTAHFMQSMGSKEFASALEGAIMSQQIESRSVEGQGFVLFPTRPTDSKVLT
jgi:hypothetical protein